MQAMLEAFVWAAGVLVIALAIGAMFRGAGRLFVDMAETLFGVIIGDLIYDPEGVQRQRDHQEPEPVEAAEIDEDADLAGWSAVELVRLAQGLQLLRLMDQTRFDFAKPDLNAGCQTLADAGEGCAAASESDGDAASAARELTEGDAASEPRE